ncbi:MAG: Mov34/MPN/PAD-1 family protein [Deltaproteobacteria bacterium]|nr:Mov34/MPN/PAD-1 family protein [Deltaproteobacteria bacterium]
MNLILSKRAFFEIEQECLKYPDVETGGILIGKHTSRDIIVPFVVGSGAAAKRTASRFEPDINWQQKLLDQCFENHGLNYVGSFHRHFGNFCCPSSMDYEAALHILTDPNWAIDRAVFPIILINKETLVIYPYYISREEPTFQLMTMSLVDDNLPPIASIIKKEGATCPES